MKGLIPLIAFVIALLGAVLYFIHDVTGKIVMSIVVLFWGLMLFSSILYLDILRMMKKIEYRFWLNQAMLVIGDTASLMAWRTRKAKKRLGIKDDVYSKEYQKSMIIVGYIVTFILIPGLIILAIIKI